MPTYELLRHFGKNLRRARVSRGITQADLARSSGLNIRTVQRIEAGQINVLITTAIRIILAIGCPPSELPPPQEKPGK